MLERGLIDRNKLFVKRTIDFVGSILAILALSPLLTIIYALIRIDSPGPGLFIQERAGMNGETFKIYKFRTMKENAEEDTSGKYIRISEEHLTRPGRKLRRWALDEIPQLFNVLIGNMSLVGPRPTLAYQVDKYDERQRRRLLVKPGLTGWAQVNGRNALTWPKRIELDVWYVENWSLLLDIKIMLMTIPALMRKDFAFAEENVEDDEIVRFEG